MSTIRWDYVGRSVENGSPVPVPDGVQVDCVGGFCAGVAVAELPEGWRMFRRFGGVRSLDQFGDGVSGAALAREFLSEVRARHAFYRQGLREHGFESLGYGLIMAAVGFTGVADDGEGVATPPMRMIHLGQVGEGVPDAEGWREQAYTVPDWLPCEYAAMLSAALGASDDCALYRSPEGLIVDEGEFLSRTGGTV